MSFGRAQSTPCPTGCMVQAAFDTTTVPTSTIDVAKTASPSSSDVYVVFSSYMVESTSIDNTACVTVQAAPVTLSTPFSVTRPPTNVTDLYSRAQSSLLSFLGLTECTLPGTVLTPDQIYNISYVQSSSMLSTSSRSNTTSFQPTSQASRGLTLRQKDTIAVATAIPIIVLSILGALAYRRARKRRLAAAAITATDVDENSAVTEGTQPYLQQKAELEALERRKHELEAHRIVYEMVGEDAIHEVSTGDERRRIPTLQELRGTEHSKELEAPTSL